MILLLLFILLHLEQPSNCISEFKYNIEEFEKTCNNSKINPLSSIVISLDDSRFARTENILANTIGFNVKRHIPTLFNSPILESKFYDLFPDQKNLTSFSDYNDKFKKYFSLTISFHDVISSFSMSPGDMNDWLFIFEDDISLHANSLVTPLCDIRAGAQLAHSDGILYLGMCPKTCYRFSHVSFLGRDYMKCFGHCAHAFGIAKWKTFSFLDLLIKISYQSKRCRTQHPLPKRCLFFDTALHDYGQMVNPIWLVGHNNYAGEGNMRGIFYQDREFFKHSLTNQ